MESKSLLEIFHFCYILKLHYKNGKFPFLEPCMIWDFFKHSSLETKRHPNFFVCIDYFFVILHLPYYLAFSFPVHYQSQIRSATEVLHQPLLFLRP